MTDTKKELAEVVDAAGKVASPYERHLGIFNPHENPVSAGIVGCGAIGSFVAVGLAKMGVKQQTLFDYDSVEVANLPVQLHNRSWIGKNKAEATKAAIEEACPEDTEIEVSGKWDGEDLKHDIVVAAVDHLPTRQAIWNGVKYDSAVKILVDARIGGQGMKVYCVNPSDGDDIKLYDASFPKGDMKGSELPCTERGVIDVSLFASALLIRAVRRWIVSHKKETYRIFDLSGEMPNIIG